jgi:DNA-binding response OmpR family regulator
MTRIAVIDDNLETMNLMNAVLAERGWELVPCRDGACAFSVIKSERPDAAIVDIWLDQPERGWGILSAIKSDPETSAIPVVMCSADRDVLMHRRQMLEKQAAAILVKPFSVDDVYRCLDYVLSLSPDSPATASASANLSPFQSSGN